ncbi:MAG TPA: EboA domain-containing protein [Geminicoccaceae bacterium]|nr:EboA domain-containing protein [Geminicoccaceae bacterium]
MPTPADLLTGWLRRQLPAAAADWLDQQLTRLGAAADRDLYVVLGLVPRRLGRDDLELTDADIAQAQAARPGWDPRGWSVDQAARVLVLLTAGGSGERFAARFVQLCRTADVAEAIAFYRGLPLYPDPSLLEAQAAEGTRSNMRAVFEAVAHRNPYPREQFSENRWNHMVLKALFVGSTLAPIQGLDQRANPALMRMLCDYAHERWAAGRPVSPELWRCVGAFADAEALADLQRVLATGAATERRAAALALAACPDPQAKALLAAAPDLAAAIERGELGWDRLAR